MTSASTLYARLGGYDAICAVVDHFMALLSKDQSISRFLAHTSHDTQQRARQLTIDYLCAEAGGPTLYAGRSLERSHRGMGITQDDWVRTMGHVAATLAHFGVADEESRAVLALIESTKKDIVD